MATNIQPKPQSDLALRQEIFSQAWTKAKESLGYAIPFDELSIEPDVEINRQMRARLARAP